MRKKTKREIVKVDVREIVESTGLPAILDRIRPEWKTKNLINRVERLLPVDPSSACQRIFNAAIHDLKEKIVVAGLDIAVLAASQNNMPSIGKPDDIERLDVSRTIHLSYYMGLLTRPEWRRLLRCYDIRRDLEHEDDEYEATPEDCLYIFMTSIDVVLSKDAIQIIKLEDVKDIVEQPSAVALSETVLDDYEHAPNPRQTEIFYFLISTALDPDSPDVVRQNSYNVLGELRQVTKKQVIIGASKKFFRSRTLLTDLKARVAYKSGIFPYLKKTVVKDYFDDYLKRLKAAGYSFRGHKSHGELLRGLIEVGGLEFCPSDLLPIALLWLVLCYIGEKSFGQWAGYRKVFYSNVGAPLALEIIDACPHDIAGLAKQLGSNKRVKANCKESEAVADRFGTILDLSRGKNL